MNEIILRDATANDATAIAAIYAHYVNASTATFETQPPDIKEMADRIKAVQSAGYPWRVAVLNNQVRGYAYANQHKARSAYRFTAENSVYIAQNHQRRGIGRVLMHDIIIRCTEFGFREMMAVIGGRENNGSINLHKALGFDHIGIARGIGWKFDRSIDVVYMQRSLL